MADSRCSCGQGSLTSGSRETVCISTMRVLDSCRDRDCFEDSRVYLTPFGQEIIDRTATVRTVDAKIVATSISVDEVPFNCGFYQITARFYIRLKFEACMAPARPQEFCGLAILEKNVVLYGGEGSVHIFRSDAGSGFCSTPVCADGCNSLPTAVIETVDPIVLSTRIAADCGACGNSFGCGCGNDACGRAFNCACGCGCEGSTLPLEVTGLFPEGFSDGGANRLQVCIGMFSVIRLERPAQYLVSASEYSVPDKECSPATNEEDPCGLFRAMAFPVNEFYPPSLKEGQGKGGCCR
ncbi:MAG: hypothetical protein E7609_05935 [Ruminococcaceae bacterium]|nr:hypothetical protein [Oscillospiraceae bacterium]